MTTSATERRLISQDIRSFIEQRNPSMTQEDAKEYAIKETALKYARENGMRYQKAEDWIRSLI